MTHDLGVYPFDEANVAVECKIEFCESVICGRDFGGVKGGA